MIVHVYHNLGQNVTISTIIIICHQYRRDYLNQLRLILIVQVAESPVLTLIVVRAGIDCKCNLLLSISVLIM